MFTSEGSGCPFTLVCNVLASVSPSSCPTKPSSLIDTFVSSINGADSLASSGSEAFLYAAFYLFLPDLFFPLGGAINNLINIYNTSRELPDEVRRVTGQPFDLLFQSLCCGAALFHQEGLVFLLQEGVI